MFRKATLQHLTKHLNSSSQVIMRADFNVPMKDSKIIDPNRIVATIPTIKELMKHNPKSLVLLSHLGRPNGTRNMKHSLKPIAEKLESLLDNKITFLDDCVGESVLDRVNRANGEIFLCENVRFHQEEEGSKKDNDGKKVKADPESVKKFREQLSRLGNVYVNDAFGSAHRAHSSVVGITHKYRVTGLLMQKQLKFMGQFLEIPKKPVLVILGGAKVNDKIKLIENMLDLANQIIIGGGMRFPFLQKVCGYKLGKTEVKYPQDPQALINIMKKAAAKGVKIHFPIDNVCAQEMKSGVKTRDILNQDGIPDQLEAFDIGHRSHAKFDEIVSRANSIFWNGPMGVFQIPEFRQGSIALLNSIVKQTKKGAISIIGGGDSASLVNNSGNSNEVTYVSTGGGATLELMQGKVLPGLKALSNVDQLD